MARKTGLYFKHNLVVVVLLVVIYNLWLLFIQFKKAIKAMFSFQVSFID
jgi:hypothetical protein